MLDYYKKWLQLAISPSFGLADVAASVVGIFVPPILLLMHQNVAEAKFANLLWQIPVCVFFFLLACWLITAPYLIHRELMQKVSGISTVDAIISKKENALNSVVNLMNELLSIRNKTIQNRAQYNAWRDEYERWWIHAFHEIGSKMSAADLVLFKTYQPRIVQHPGSFNSSHNAELEEIEAFKRRLVLFNYDISSSISDLTFRKFDISEI